jgi:hypothetical protein
MMALLRQQNVVLSAPEKFLAPVLEKLDAQASLAARLWRSQLEEAARPRTPAISTGSDDLDRVTRNILQHVQERDAEKRADSVKSESDSKADERE